MTGVSVDTTAPPTQVDLDFRAIYEGGENFLARAQALANLRTQHDISYANLRVGQDARKALDDAQQNRDKAQAALDEAKATLASANQQAADMLQKARDQAAEIVKNAQDEAAALAESARSTKADADDYAAKKRRAADQSLKKAQDLEASSTVTRDELKNAVSAAQAEKAAYEDARLIAESMKNDFQDRISRLNKFIQGLMR